MTTNQALPEVSETRRCRCPNLAPRRRKHGLRNRTVAPGAIWVPKNVGRFVPVRWLISTIHEIPVVRSGLGTEIHAEASIGIDRT
jgi:hypothetical protein